MVMEIWILHYNQQIIQISNLITLINPIVYTNTKWTLHTINNNFTWQSNWKLSRYALCHCSVCFRSVFLQRTRAHNTRQNGKRFCRFFFWIFFFFAKNEFRLQFFDLLLVVMFSFYWDNCMSGSSLLFTLVLVGVALIGVWLAMPSKKAAALARAIAEKSRYIKSMFHEYV